MRKLALAFAALFALAAPAEAARLTVYGNSYSSPGSAKWPAQLLTQGRVSSVFNLAVGGSTAGSYSSKTFAQQVSRGHPRTGDIVVVFHGQNDATWAGIAPSKYPGNARVVSDYRAQLERLRTPGASLYLVLGFDWAKVPRYATGDATYARSRVHSAVLGINAGIESAAPSFGAHVIDTYAPMECVFLHPAAFGFSNVRSPGSSSTYLFMDRYHMGSRGQALLAHIIDYTIHNGASSPAQIFPGKGC